ncbi:hypothetical protein [Chryseobacterium lactis]|uniref:hypothetical protein n=1 Tax=Chryseobacterium lactis TaxID=1241981 RepID=UPI00162580D2|nr:hypothetical protein [Chryseobacterium lactis]
MCICKVTEQHGNFFNAECEGPNGKKFYSIQAENAQDALVKARQMCIDNIGSNHHDVIEKNTQKSQSDKNDTNLKNITDGNE